jgi:hypothetical protein
MGARGLLGRRGSETGIPLGGETIWKVGRFLILEKSDGSERWSFFGVPTRTEKTENGRNVKNLVLQVYYYYVYIRFKNSTFCACRIC